MKRVVVVILLLSTFFHLAKAQGLNFKWGKVSAYESELGECSFDESANAVILFDVGKIIFRGGTALINRHRRIKILNKRGLEYADIQIPYYSGGNLEAIEGLKAQTLLVGSDGKVTKKSVEGKDVFDNNLDSKWSEKRFTFPGVEEGVILEYRYTLATNDILFLDAWTFQNELPTLHSELEVELPTYLTYRYLMNGPKLPQKYAGKTEVTNKWVLNNLPGYKDENYVYNYLSYTDRIRFQLINYHTRSAMGGMALETLMQDWPELKEELLDGNRYFLSKDKLAKNLLVEIIEPTDSDREKLQKIFYWVQQNTNWNGYLSYINAQSPKQLLETKTGNGADINLLLLNLCENADLKARPVLISTRGHGKVYQNVTFLNQFNHLVVNVLLEDESILMDAATSLDGQAYDVLPTFDLNEHGLILEKGEAEWIEIKPAKTNRTCYVELNLSSSDAESCKVSFKFSGHFGNEQKAQLRKSPNQVFIPEEINFGTVAYQFKEKVEEQTEQENASFSTSYLLEPTEDLVEDQMIYINPMSLHAYLENPFKREKRYLPLELPFPFADSYVFNITLPGNYEIESIPESTSLKLEGALGRFSYMTTVGDNSIQIVARTIIRKSLIEPYQYPNFRMFFEKLTEKLNEPIVLKKK